MRVYQPRPSTEYQFASGSYKEGRWLLQVACSCLITVLRVPLLCVLSLSWLIDVTVGYVMSVGVHLALTHPRYAFSGSLIHISVHKGTM
jgi:hypothetical protein